MHTGIRELMDNLSRYIRRVEADGRMIAFDSNRRGHRDLYQKAVGGVGAEELLLESAEDKVTGDWSADGRWVAYLSDELGRPNVYVRQFAAVAAVAAAEASSPVGQWQVSKAGGIFPVWGPDGKELYYLNPEGALMGAPITVTGATLDTGAPVVALSHAHPRRWSRCKSRPPVRCRPRRALPHQHRARRRGDADHTGDELESRGEEVSGGCRGCRDVEPLADHGDEVNIVSVLAEGEDPQSKCPEAL